MSDPTFFAQDYNISPWTWHPQFQTPRFSCELTISGTDNVRPHAFRARLQYQSLHVTPTISDPTLFVRDYNNDHKPTNPRQRFIFWAITQPHTFMSRHTSRLKGFIYLIKDRPNVTLHFKISVNDMYLRYIPYHTLWLQVDDLFSPIHCLNWYLKIVKEAFQCCRWI